MLASCQAAPPPPAPAAPAPAEVLAVTAPDAGWRLRVERVIELDQECWILARLWREPGFAAQVIQPAKATIPVALPAKPRKVFVEGKTWTWPNPETYEFVPSLEAVVRRANGGRVLYVAPPPSTN
ncbi:MAG TPA: hypothetical protein VG838_18310 [Opitutaceae bacterium]|nr:hypothetical protein [Lacunisphaera sp.]HWA11399.1 hypothetical protein [Opitutaceae bacterium]